MNKQVYAEYILRFGLGVVFIWIGILVLKSPEGWGAYMQPWAQELLISPIKTTMIIAGVADILFGILLFSGKLTWLGALLGSLHLIVIVVTVGLNEIGLRDLGILVGSVALFFLSFPDEWVDSSLL